MPFIYEYRSFIFRGFEKPVFNETKFGRQYITRRSNRRNVERGEPIKTRRVVKPKTNAASLVWALGG